MCAIPCLYRSVRAGSHYHVTRVTSTLPQWRQKQAKSYSVSFTFIPFWLYYATAEKLFTIPLQLLVNLLHRKCITVRTAPKPHHKYKWLHTCTTFSLFILINQNAYMITPPIMLINKLQHWSMIFLVWVHFLQIHLARSEKNCKQNARNTRRETATVHTLKYIMCLLAEALPECDIHAFPA